VGGRTGRSVSRRHRRRRLVAVAAALGAAVAAAALIDGLQAQPRTVRPRTLHKTAAHVHAVAVPKAPAAAFPSAAAIRRAIAYLKTRDCEAALAVVDTRGTLRGYRAGVTFTSASVVKAMLLVQYLRTHDVVSSSARATLSLMITQSDDQAAFSIYAIVHAQGLRRLATLAGMKHFSPGENVLYSRITAADQARFFDHLDDYVPKAQWRYARYLLTHVVSKQTWGVAEVARPRWTVLFKSGWLGASADPFSLVNQVARLERGSRVWSLALLSEDNPHSPCAFVTLRGVTRRLLGEE